MTQAYLNGSWLPLEHAQISVLDRGFLFGDGVYEVIPVYNGRPLRLAQHLQRLGHSLEGIRLKNPHNAAEWQQRIAELIQRSGKGDQLLYLQVTRGVAPRDHAFPAATTPATVLLFSKPYLPPDEARFEQGIEAGLTHDPRWQLCHLKTVNLLANVLLKQMASDSGFDEMLLQYNGWLTEGTSSNVFVVRAGVIATPPLSANILPGITRDLILQLAQESGLPLEQRPVAASELQEADEIWISSSSRELMPVTRLQGCAVGTGAPGPLARQLHNALRTYATRPQPVSVAA